MAWLMCMDCGQRLSDKKQEEHDMACAKKKNTRRFGSKPTIKELEAILNSEDETAISILPNGEIVDVNYKPLKKSKPLTMKEDLGGEYAA